MNLEETQRLNRVLFAEMVKRFTVMPLDQLKAFVADGSNNVMEILIASMMLHDLADGSSERLDSLLARLGSLVTLPIQ